MSDEIPVKKTNAPPEVLVAAIEAARALIKVPQGGGPHPPQKYAEDIGRLANLIIRRTYGLD